MKTTKWLIGIVMAVAIVLAGCSKSAPPPPQAGPDMPKLRETFSTANAEVQASINKIGFGLRYGEYAQALAEIDKLNANTTLTEPQKKALAQFGEELKKKAAAPKAQ